MSVHETEVDGGVARVGLTRAACLSRSGNACGCAKLPGRRGAVAARRAHNPKVAGSSPAAASFPTRSSVARGTPVSFTGGRCALSPPRQSRRSSLPTRRDESRRLTRLVGCHDACPLRRRVTIAGASRYLLGVRGGNGVPLRPFGGIAQLVEHPAHTRYVPGSNPGAATNAAHQAGDGRSWVDAGAPAA